MTTTARDICAEALGDLMVNGVGQSMSAADGDRAFDKLNNLLDQWASESLMLYSDVRTTWVLVANQTSYTVGTGGNVAVARPVYVDSVGFIDTSQSPTLEIPLTPLTDQDYAAIPIKGLTSTLQGYYYYNLTFPLATLSMYPIPTRTDLQGVIYARSHVTEFASLSTVVSLPPGWRRMMVANLAVECAPAWEREPSSQLQKIAAESKATLKRSQIRLVDAKLDGGALIGGNRNHSGYYDFLVGRF